MRAKTIAEEDALSFLSRKAVIPKYGFPVDVVELDIAERRNRIKKHLKFCSREISALPFQNLLLPANWSLIRRRWRLLMGSRKWPRKSGRESVINDVRSTTCFFNGIKVRMSLQHLVMTGWTFLNILFLFLDL
ncbi:MAG: hypothetical protein RQM89_11265 [Acetomicrobium sp.]